MLSHREPYIVLEGILKSRPLLQLLREILFLIFTDSPGN